MSDQRKLTILEMLFAVLVVVSNVISPKVLEFGQIILPGSAFTYIFTFFISNIISENYGAEESKACVKQGIAAQALATAFFILVRHLPAQDPQFQNSYVDLLGKNWIFVIADLTACITAHFTQIVVFNRIRSALNGSLGNIISMIASQFLDTLIFLTIAYGIGFTWITTNRPMLLNMFISQYIVKIVIALILTPLFPLFVNKRS